MPIETIVQDPAIDTIHVDEPEETYLPTIKMVDTQCMGKMIVAYLDSEIYDLVDAEQVPFIKLQQPQIFRNISEEWKFETSE